MKPHTTKSKPRIAPMQCSTCEGNGYSLSGHPCSQCNGTGYFLPKKPKPSPRQPKGGRVMWRVRSEESASCSELYQDEYAAANAVACAEEHDLAASMEPVLVLPLSPEARERRVEAGARSIESMGFSVNNREIVRRVLSALGDSPAGEGRGK